MSVNREYKSSVFTELFSDPAKLLSLYNAIAGSSLPSDTPIKIATLEKVLFTKRRNDIAFVLGDKIVVLMEHQSTVNQNMPLRMLLYIARVYEKLVDNSAIYKGRLVKIQKPDFIVLYNGIEPYPEETTLRLSDAYTEAGSPPMDFGGLLELEVRVVNINEGCNSSLVRKCEALSGYVRLVAKIRANNAAGMDLDDAVTKAVRDCIDEGILKEFLENHASEVANMLTAEWNEDIAIEVWKSEGREETRERYEPLLASMAAENASMAAENASMAAENASKDAEIASMAAELAVLRAKLNAG